MHPAVYALGIPALLGIVAFIYCKVTFDGPSASIVVVDRRTMRLAYRRIAAAIEAGNTTRALAGLTSMIIWLDSQIKTGPARRRVEYARYKEMAELCRDQINEGCGLPPWTV